MSRALHYVPRVAIFLAGIAAGALTTSRRGRGGVDAGVARSLKASIADLENRLSAQQSAGEERFSRMEATLEEHTARLADVPSTSQIVAAMEGVLSKTMTSLDERLTTQARSIEVLKTTVSQTDNLLERVLESLDSLQAYSDPAAAAIDPQLKRPCV